MLVISLTSIPPRFGQIGPTLESLMAQDLPADHVQLYIADSYARFPDWDGALPDVPAGVEILRGADLGPATKILHAARANQGQDVDLLFCDDDRVYPPHWSRNFCAARGARPGAALCWRGMMVHWKIGGAPRATMPQAVPRPDWLKRIERLVSSAEDRLFLRSGHVDMFEGCGGVMVRPEMFDDSDFDIPEVARSVDDVWLSGMLARKGVPIWLIAGQRSPALTAAHRAAPLADPARHGRNIAAIEHLQEQFGIWHA